jgi:copper chaperone CopZ
MAGPATNVATIGAIYRTLGGRNLAIYMVNVILGSLLLGWLFQGVIDPGAVSDVVAHGMEHSEWWRVGTAVLLTASFIYFAYSDLRQRFAAAKIERENTDDADSLTVGVSGMTCNGCVSKLTRNLQAVDGVEFAAVSLEPGSATIQGHASRSEIESAIRSSGFEPEETGADNASTCCSSA